MKAYYTWEGSFYPSYSHQGQRFTVTLSKTSSALSWSSLFIRCIVQSVMIRHSSCSEYSVFITGSYKGNSVSRKWPTNFIFYLRRPAIAAHWHCVSDQVASSLCLIPTYLRLDCFWDASSWYNASWINFVPHCLASLFSEGREDLSPPQ